MLAFLGKWMLVIAMITAIGGHFMVLQSVAWTTMVIANARHGNLAGAFEKTFDGQHPCALCKTIQKARETENKRQAPQVAATKLDLFLQPRSFMLPPVFVCRGYSLENLFAQAHTHLPLLEPPRNFIEA